MRENGPLISVQTIEHSKNTTIHLHYTKGFYIQHTTQHCMLYELFSMLRGGWCIYESRPPL